MIDNWQESGLADDKLMLDPDVAKYCQMEELGMVFCLAAFSGDRIVGYSMNFVVQHMHASKTVFAGNDVIFVTQEFRNSRAGLMLIKETEREAKRRGASMMVWGAKPDTALATLVQRLGYVQREISFVKGI